MPCVISLPPLLLPLFPVSPLFSYPIQTNSNLVRVFFVLFCITHTCTHTALFWIFLIQFCHCTKFEPHETDISNTFKSDEDRKSDRFHKIHTYCFLSTENLISPSSCLSSVIFMARQESISVPCGHYTTEFPRSSPISILLDCDTEPDVAAPLATRVSLLTGFLAHVFPGVGGARQSRKSTFTYYPSPLSLVGELLSYSIDNTSCQSWRVSFGIDVPQGSRPAQL